MPGQPRLLTTFLLACALFLRMAVPAGWMPSPTGGLFAIELCSAAAPSAVHAMDGDHGKSSHHDPQGKSHNGDCSFAPFQAGFAAAADAPVIAASSTSAALVSQHSTASFFATGPPAPPPPATGPPALT